MIFLSDMVEVKIKYDGDETLLKPEYATAGSAGCDLVNAENKFFQLLPGARVFLHTGIHIQLPEGYEAQVRGRSGLNKKHGIVVPVGTIDSDYTGEIGVVVYNLSDEPYSIRPGERIAQLVISPVERAQFIKVDELDKTERSDGGFGHTGR